MNLTSFKDLIRERAGITFDASGEENLAEEIAGRMAEKKLKKPTGYFHLLKRDSAEFHRLVNLLTVNETYFFREPGHISLLMKEIIPAILKKRKRDGGPDQASGGPSSLSETQKIRILSAGCSTGEEIYSIAIALNETFGDRFADRFYLAGFDIDTEAVRQARSGDYPVRAFRTRPSPRISRYFDAKEGSRIRVKPEIRNAVRFEDLNLMDIPYPESIGRMDVIFYRNVSIYFEKEIRRKILENLSRILNPGGYLFVSSTETLSNDLNVLALTEKNGIFLFQKNPPSMPRHPKTDAPAALPPPSAFSRGSSGFSLPSPQKPSPLSQPDPPKPATAVPPPLRIPKEQKADAEAETDHYARARKLAGEKKYDRALSLLEAVESGHPDFTKAQALKASLLINLKQTEAAESICRELVEADPLCMDGHFLMGLIAKNHEEPEKALGAFKKTLYIRYENWVAHFFMARLYQSMGNSSLADRSFRAVKKLLDGGAFQNHGLSFFTEAFSEAEIRRTCEYGLSQLQRPL